MVSSISDMSGINSALMQQMRQDMFTRLDTNGDGSIDRSELEAMSAEHESRTGQAMDIDEIFAADDVNGDGVIDETEFMESTYRPQGAPEGPPPGPPPEMAATSSDSELGSIQSLLEMLNDSEKTDSIDLYV